MFLMFFLISAMSLLEPSVLTLLPERQEDCLLMPGHKCCRAYVLEAAV